MYCDTKISRLQVKFPPQVLKLLNLKRKCIPYPPPSDNALHFAALATPSKVACAVALALFSSISSADVVTETLESGEHIFSGNTTLQGGASVGQNGSLSVTVNGSSLTFSNAGLNLDFGNYTEANFSVTGENSEIVFNGKYGYELGAKTVLNFKADTVIFKNGTTAIDRSGGGQNVNFSGDVLFTGEYSDQIWYGRSNSDYNVTVGGEMTFRDVTAAVAIHDWNVDLVVPELIVENGTFNSTGLTSAMLFIDSTVHGSAGQSGVGSITLKNIHGATRSSTFGNFFATYFEQSLVDVADINIDGVYNTDNYGGVVGLVPGTEATLKAANSIVVNDVHGTGSDVATYGVWISSDSRDRYGNTTVETPLLQVTNIVSDNNQAFGVFMDDVGTESKAGKEFLTTDQTIIQMVSGTAAAGLYLRNDATLTSKSLVVGNVTGTQTEALGIQVMNSSLLADSVNIAGVNGVSATTGLLIYGGAANGKSLNISAVKSNADTASSTLLDVVGAQAQYANADLTFRTVDDDFVFDYQGTFDQEAQTGRETVRDVAVRSTLGSRVLFTDVNGVYRIEGNLVAGRGTSDTSSQAGSIEIGGAETLIFGDVYAGNGGQIVLTLNGKDGTASQLVGQVDDYHELADVAAGTVFHNSAFVDVMNGSALDVAEAGHVTLNLNGGHWTALGQSFVENVNFQNPDSHINMTAVSNSSVSIKNLTGSGQFDMVLGAYSPGAETIKTDMLYIQNVAAGSVLTINATLADGVNVSDLEGLRFATVGKVEGGHSTNLFKFVEIKDQGFNDWKLNVAREDYRTDDVDNSRFNGTNDGEGIYKPGEDVVDAIYGETSADQATLTEEEKSQNYFIDAIEKVNGGGEDNPSGPTISDAGQAVIATARGLYYSAIEIDRFNQRYGDRHYDENNKSLWARVRHDRWGTDAGVGDFKSQNTTYQMGVDYTKPSEHGKMIYGVAVDLMDGNTDYESIDGSGETKRYAVSAYATYMGDNGGYLDVVGKVGRLSNEYAVKLDSGAGISADYMNWMAGISVEAGHQFTGDNSSWFAEPQIQAQYVFVSDNDYSNGQTKIEQDSIHSFITRAGFRAGHWLDKEKNANVYFKADVLHEWAGNQDIYVSDQTTVRGRETFSINNHGTWFDVGLGFQAPMGKSFYAYGDAEYRFGNDLYQTWTFNLGGKYVF